VYRIVLLLSFLLRRIKLNI